jgi:lysine 6-dehydrogenase
LKVAIFGSGLMGSALARDLAKSKIVDEVSVFDIDRKRLNALGRIDRSGKISVRAHDVRRISDTVRLLKRFQVGIGALPHGLSEYAVESTVRAGVNFVDLIFGWRFGKGRIHSLARRKGITVIPACGLAPGLTNVLSMAGADQMDSVNEVHIKVGGIPAQPKPPLNYRIVFSFNAVLEEYLRKARIVRDGKIIDVPALSGLERVTFRRPIGACECFYTDGLSTLVHTLKRVRHMDEKTIRWPGHVAQIKTLIECGLLETKPVSFEGKHIIPRKLTESIISDRIRLRDDKDLTLMRVDVEGKRNGRNVHRQYEMIDEFDAKHGITSMARTTAFPCSIAAQMLGAGEVTEKGLVPPEIAFRGELRHSFLRYLKTRGMRITSTLVT